MPQMPHMRAAAELERTYEVRKYLSTYFLLSTLSISIVGCTYVWEVRERILIPIKSEALQRESLKIGADTTNL